MRCIREGHRAKCNRCSDARADCIFSIAKKAGRPSASCRRVLTIAEEDGQDSCASTRPASSPHTLDNERQQEQEQEQEQEHQGTSSSDLFAAEPSCDLDVDLSNYFLEPPGSASLLEDVSSPTVSFDIDVSTTSISDTNASSNPCFPWLESHDRHPRQRTNQTNTEEEGQAIEQAAVDRYTTLPPSTTFAYPVELVRGEGTGHSGGSGVAGRKRDRVPALALEPELPGFQAGGAAGGSYAASATGDAQANTMQQLSDLGRKLFAQSTATPAKRHVARRHSSYAPRNSDVTNLGAHGDTSTEADNVNMPLDRDNRNSNSECTPVNSLDDLTAHVIESSSAFYDILRRIPPRASFDMAATMLILTTYIRLAQLHHTFYTFVQSVLPPSESHSPFDAATTVPYPTPHSSEHSSSFIHTTTAMAATATTAATSPHSSTPILFPHLQIGGVSLAAYPRFQLKFILQICVHHLGEVELLLGLPAESCVGGGENGQRYREFDG